MQTIVVTNRKGGVGKTTIATHLAAGLALRGFRVTLIDTDPQGHAAVSFGMRKENGLYQIMVNEDASFADVLRQVPQERFAPPGFAGTAELYLLPSENSTAVIPIQQPSPFAFKEKVEALSDLLTLDFVIVDTGPTASMFDGSVYFAADWMLYVTECEMLSFDGLSEAMKDIAKLNRDNVKYRHEEIHILGIVPNKGRFGTSNHRQNIALLGESFPKQVWTPITQRTIWGEASAHGQLVYSFAPGGQEERDAWGIVDQALHGVMAHAR